jgi:hypothetical protein
MAAREEMKLVPMRKEMWPMIYRIKVTFVLFIFPISTGLNMQKW